MDGYAAAHGMPELADLSMSRFCSFVWHMITRYEDEQGRAKLRARLWRPPAGEDIPDESPWSPSAERDAFSALKKALGSGKG